MRTHVSCAIGVKLAVVAERTKSQVIAGLTSPVIPEEEQVYKSVDTVVDISEAVQYPTEFLKFLKPPGMPPHSLKLNGIAQLCCFAI